MVFVECQKSEKDVIDSTSADGPAPTTGPELTGPTAGDNAEAIDPFSVFVRNFMRSGASVEKSLLANGTDANKAAMTRALKSPSVIELNDPSVMFAILESPIGECDEGTAAFGKMNIRKNMPPSKCSVLYAIAMCAQYIQFYNTSETI